jgi:hypothetical protein
MLTGPTTQGLEQVADHPARISIWLHVSARNICGYVAYKVPPLLHGRHQGQQKFVIGQQQPGGTRGTLKVLVFAL